MLYFKNKISPIEGLCNQLMGIICTIIEAKLAEQPSGIILSNVQSRTSINTPNDPNWITFPADRFFDITELRKLLFPIKVELEDNFTSNDEIKVISRFPQYSISPEEYREIGILISKLPFAAHVLEVANFIIDQLSSKKWISLHIRIEGDLNVNNDPEGLLKNREQQKLNAIEAINNPELDTVYIASGMVEDDFKEFCEFILKDFKNISIKRKKEIVSNFPKMEMKLHSLSLEEQALVDWIVCINSPQFYGWHKSSFAYLASYMRHYRGCQKNHLWPDYQPLWERWFPCI